MSDELVGTLKEGEAHPAAYHALNWLKNMQIQDLMVWQSAFSSCALSGNRLAEVCSETLRRLIDQEPVSDRYLLGLAWSMRDGKGSIESEAPVAGPESEGQGASKDGGVKDSRKVRNTKKRGKAGSKP